MKRKLYLLLLSALGFQAAACDKENEPQQMCMYGTPSIDFRIQGKVTDTAGRPIAGIEVCGGEESYPDIVPVHTDEKGLYDISGSAHSIDLDLSFRDIDGPENGGDFETETLAIKFTVPEQTAPGEGWSHGSYFRADVDITLTEKSPAQEE